MVVVRGTGAIRTKREFDDVQLHIEWATPAEVVGEGQGRGNSGVFLQGRYEVQVLDSYNNKTYFYGQAGSIYKQYLRWSTPAANPANGRPTTSSTTRRSSATTEGSSRKQRSPSSTTAS